MNYQKERKKLVKTLKWAQKNIPSVTLSPKEEYLVIVQRVEDFDLSSNKLWKIEENKSYPREGINCEHCNSPVVVSNEIFLKFITNLFKFTFSCDICQLKRFNTSWEKLKKNKDKV